MGKLNKRPEIDGLRAIAIIPVVLFHAELGFPGGYVGVDVFFVISGFLITSLIWKDVKVGSFSITEFWERRIRRIMPALVAMILTCLVLGWCVLLPQDFKKLAESVVAQALGLSNVYFWQQAGYFSADVIQPVLHTWSLAVEEQFYLLFPFLLIVAWRFGRTAIVALLILLAALSFTLCIYLTRTHLMAAFYLLPTRAWELLVGSLLAMLPSCKQSITWVDQGLSVVGGAAIIVAMFAYDKSTPFPGAAAMLPCLGTAAIIWSNSSGKTWVGRALSCRPLVGIGVISYSLYLWHWPVLIYSNYWAADTIPWPYRLVLVAVSFFLALASWRWIEEPFRQKRVLPESRYVFAYAGASLAILIAAACWINLRDGLGRKWTPAALHYATGQLDRESWPESDLQTAQSGKFPELGMRGSSHPVDVLVWGDSHARALLPVLNKICAEHRLRGVAATHSATIPLIDYRSTKRFSLAEDTVPFNRAVLEFIKSHHIRTVFITARWNAYLAPDEERSGRFERAARLTAALLRTTGARVFFVKDVPNLDFHVPRKLAVTVERSIDPHKIGLTVVEHQSRTEYESHVFDQISGGPVSVLDPTPLLTNKEGRCRIEQDGLAMYSDRHHLTTFGAMQLRPLFEPVLDHPASAF